MSSACEANIKISGGAEVQKRATRVVRSGADAIIQSVTGSGKTMAFLMPLLSALVYPPQAYPESFLVRAASLPRPPHHPNACMQRTRTTLGF